MGAAYPINVNGGRAMKTDYVAFCLSCGFPKQLPRHILEHYLNAELAVCWFYCDHCHEKNILPDYLKKIINDL